MKRIRVQRSARHVTSVQNQNISEFINTSYRNLDGGEPQAGSHLIFERLGLGLTIQSWSGWLCLPAVM